jgi:hypothetical protein
VDCMFAPERRPRYSGHLIPVHTCLFQIPRSAGSVHPVRSGINSVPLTLIPLQVEASSTDKYFFYTFNSTPCPSGVCLVTVDMHSTHMYVLLRTQSPCRRPSSSRLNFIARHVYPGIKLHHFLRAPHRPAPSFPRAA